MEIVLHCVAFILAASAACVWGQGRWGGMGPGMMAQRGMGMGMGNQAGMMGGPGTGRDYMTTFHDLLNAHQQIKRTYSPTTKGITSETWSDNPQVAVLIQKHVAEMKRLMEACAKGACPAQPRFFDPLFAAAYTNAASVDIEVTPTAKGVKVVESGANSYATQLVQAHAAVVSKFVQNGMAEMMNSHQVPKPQQATLKSMLKASSDTSK